MNSPPRKVAERGLFRPVWIVINQMIDYMREIAVVGGRNIQRTRTLNGTLLVPDEVKQAATPTEPGTIKRYLIRSVEADHLVCAEVGGADGILIAKPWRLRRTPFDGQAITFDDENGGTYTVNYTYTTSIKRTVRIGQSFTEVQVVIPRYKPDFDYIFAMSAENGTGVTDVDLIDINADGRAWARSRST